MEALMDELLEKLLVEPAERLPAAKKSCAQNPKRRSPSRSLPVQKGQSREAPRIGTRGSLLASGKPNSSVNACLPRLASKPKSSSSRHQAINSPTPR